MPRDSRRRARESSKPNTPASDVLRTTIQGSLYVGVFAHACDRIALVGGPVDGDTERAIEEEFDTPVVVGTIGGASTVGALATGNASGLVVSGRLTEGERDAIESSLGGSIAPLPGRVNAAGNCLLVNDYGAIVHPGLSDTAVDVVERALDVPVERFPVGGVKTVGTAAVATNRGVLCHPKVADSELDRLEAVLDVRADVGTVNYGSPLIGSGLVANSRGVLTGADTTGPELGRIEEALGFLD